ncbi:MAG: hypothetical protein K8H74_07945 [Notoacmeibacter sp.]|nr:hypothetical protein [Notoacmeibacter sp.]
MRSIRFIIAACALTLAGVQAAAADAYLGSYVARISYNDHLASDGYRLDTASQVVRQDRANFHRFGKADAEDQYDGWFTSNRARANLQNMLDRRGAMDAATRNAILGGQPLIEVEVYQYSVRVRILAY